MANFITISRMILAIITVLLLFKHTNTVYITAFILTILVIWMDGLDGFFARLLHESSKFGALLDILGDRVVENVYWITFAVVLPEYVPVWIPLVVVTRGLLTDGVRSVAFEKGYTAFGSTTMMQGKIAKFIVASNFVRFSYAVCKAMAFALIIAANIPADYMYKDTVSTIAIICTYVTVFLCVLRGVPVLIESRRFFKNDEQQ